jgi:hypothetical protein
MGDAVAAVSDATWAEANPANLTGLDGSLVTFSHTSWFEDISLETLTFGTSAGAHGFGISVVGLHTEPLDGYDYVGHPQGTFRFFDLAVSASYARKIGRSLSVGVSGKTLYEKIDWDSATGFGIDLGLGYVVPVRLLGGVLATGGALRNLGSKMGYHEEEFDLPLTWQAGLSYRAGWLPEWMHAVIAVDFEKTRDQDEGVLAGFELELHDMLALRLGHRGTSEEGKATVGIGLSWAPATVDYAFVDMGETLGTTHRVSVSFTTGSVFPSPDAAP